MKYLRNTRLLFGVVLAIVLSLYAPIEVVYLNKVGIPMSIISILNLIVPVSCALLEIPTGILGDYIGRKKILILCMLAFFTSMVLLIFAKDTYQFFIVYILEGLGWSLFSGNTDSIIYEEAIEKKVDVSKQLAFMYTAFAIGPIVSGVLNTTILGVPNINFEALIIISAIARGAGVFLAFFITTKNDISNKDKAKRLSPFGILMESFKLIKSSTFTASVIIYEATGRLTFYLPVIIQPLLFKSGVSLMYFGIIFTLSQVVSLIAQYKVDVIIKKLGMDFILKASPIAMTIGLLLLLVPSRVCIIGCLIIIQLVSPIRSQCLTLQKNSLVNNEIRATYVSTISFAVLLFNAAFLSLVGIILENNFNTGISILTTICLLGGILLYKNLINIKSNCVDSGAA